jgi:hypothetical protein
VQLQQVAVTAVGGIRCCSCWLLVRLYSRQRRAAHQMMIKQMHRCACSTEYDEGQHERMVHTWAVLYPVLLVRHLQPSC